MEAATIRPTAAVADGAPMLGGKGAAVGCGKRRERRYEPEGERLSKYRGHAGEEISGNLPARGHGVGLGGHHAADRNQRALTSPNVSSGRGCQMSSTISVTSSNSLR